jgi:hypothetical protein
MDILSLVKEPLFWVATTIGGLLWNVVGNLITPFFQQNLARLYENRNKKRVLSILEKRTKVEKFFISYDDRDSTKLDVIHGLLRALALMVIGIAFFLAAEVFPYPLTYPFYFVGAYAFYLGIKVFDEQNLLLNQVRLAQEREQELRKWMEEFNISPSETEKLDEFLVHWDSEKFGVPETDLRAHLKTAALTHHSSGTGLQPAP